MSTPAVTLAGSYSKHLDRILAVRAEFVALGADVLRPASDEVVSRDGFVLLAGDPEDAAGVREEQFAAINASSLLYLVNPGGYVGAAATMEAGYATALGIPVVSAEEPFETEVELVVSGFGDPAQALDILEKLRSGS